MPPASRPATLVARMASSSDVFAVIDVAHDGDHGRTLHQILLFLGQFDFLDGFFFVAHRVGGGAEARARSSASFTSRV